MGTRQRGLRGGRALAEHGLEVAPLAGGGGRPQAHVPVLEQRQAHGVARALPQRLPPPLLRTQRRLQGPVIRLELRFSSSGISMHSHFGVHGVSRRIVQ